MRSGRSGSQGLVPILFKQDSEETKHSLSIEDFEDDSPSFWDFVEVELNHAEQLSESFTEVGSLLRKAFPCHRERDEHRAAWEQLHGAIAGVSPADKQLVPLVQTLRDFRAGLDAELQERFVGPLRSGLAEELKTLKEKREAHDALLNEYLDELKTRLTQKTLSAADESDPSSVAKKVPSDRNMVDLSRFDLITSLELLRKTRSTYLLKALSAYMKAQKDYAARTLRLIMEHQAEVESLNERLAKTEDEITKYKLDRQTLRRSLEKKYVDPYSEEKDSTGMTGIRDVDFKPSATAQKSKSGYMFLPFKFKQAKEAGVTKGKAGRSRVWCVVSKGKLRIFKKGENRFEVDLLTCTVKEAPETRLKHCFHLISPHESLTMQAESHDEMQQWMSVISNAISGQLNRSSIDEDEELESPKSPRFGDAILLTGARGRGSISLLSENSSLLRRVVATEGNTVCADCGAPSPDWTSINLGIVICVECSGIHRFLGVQTSQVRSLTLDRLDTYICDFLVAMGNSKSNSIWLKNMSLDSVIFPDSPREDKKTWITAKYDKSSAQRRMGLTQEEADQTLLQACAKGDLAGAMFAKAAGASLAGACDAMTKETALHLAIKGKHLPCAELLAKNGAKLSAPDLHERTPLHLATALNFEQGVRFLLQRGATQTLVDGQGLTALDLAVQEGCCDAIISVLSESSTRTQQMKKRQHERDSSRDKSERDFAESELWEDFLLDDGKKTPETGGRKTPLASTVMKAMSKLMKKSP